MRSFASAIGRRLIVFRLRRRHASTHAKPKLVSWPSYLRIAMNRFGLALSGGGFRATLYHLGVVRCLRDAGVLPKITHITTVSGGSILGAHLALNWERYCGTPEQFDEVAAEIIRFVQLDVRNRIVRRFPTFAAVPTIST